MTAGLLGQDTVYPEVYDIYVSSSLSGSNIEIDDTVTVRRTISNNAGFELTNLYLVDVMPQEFELLSYSLQLNGQPVNHYFSGSLPDHLMTGYNAFRWLIDEPSPDDQLNITLAPGDSLKLTYFFTCSDTGSYVLPLHSFVFEGGQSGFFSLNSPESVTIGPSAAYGALAGTVTDADMQPTENVLVRLAQGFQDYTDNAGYYLITQVNPGIYDVNLYHPAYGDSVIGGAAIDSGQTTALDVIWDGTPMEYIYLPGDINGDDQLIGSDITYGVNYFRGTGNPPPDSMWNPVAGQWHYAAADGNGDCLFIGSDITYLMAYFRTIHDYMEWCPETPPF